MRRPRRWSSARNSSQGRVGRTSCLRLSRSSVGRRGHTATKVCTQSQRSYSGARGPRDRIQVWVNCVSRIRDLCQRILNLKFATLMLKFATLMRRANRPPLRAQASAHCSLLIQPHSGLNRVECGERSRLAVDPLRSPSSLLNIISNARMIGAMMDAQPSRVAPWPRESPANLQPAHRPGGGICPQLQPVPAASHAVWVVYVWHDGPRQP